MPVTAALAWAPSATLLLAGRVLQGLAAAFAPAAIAYLAERGTPRQPTWGVALYTHESTSPAALILALATASFSSTAQELLPMNPSITQPPHSLLPRRTSKRHARHPRPL